MYMVYRLRFGEAGVYIGCTNNIERRKNQHNENARKQKSKLGRFLHNNGIVLSQNDFEIIYKSEDRANALAVEREVAFSQEKDGHILLNDNYSSQCSRKGKNIGHTAQEYVVIDFVSHTEEEVYDLRQYCIKNGIDYRLLHRTTKSGHSCGNRYCAFKKEEWDTLQDKGKYLSGSFLDDVKENVREALVNRAKTYEVSFPDLHVERVTNLDKFAREHNLTPGTFHATLIKGKPTKGYQVLRRI